MSRCRHDRPLDEWVRGVCNYGNCTELACPDCGTSDVGWGPIECPCDHTRGWNRPRLAERGKPPVAVKPVGRHAHRVRRRRRELAKHRAWCAEWSDAVRGA